MSDSERSDSESTSGTGDTTSSSPIDRPLTIRSGDYNSARETSGSPTPPPQSITVKDAINEAPAAELKSLMQRLSANVPEARTFIEAALLRPIDNAESSTNALKRKATEECKNCEEYYEVEDKKKKRCRYHPCKFSPVLFRVFNISSLCLPNSLALVAGPELDLRSKAWDYHDYRVDGHAEDLVDDPTYKDGFIMSCCYKRPYESGCVVSRHKPKVNTVGNKRVRR